MTSTLLFLAMVAAAPRPDCGIELPPPDAAFIDLAAALAQVDEAFPTAHKRCVPALDYIRGEALRLIGEPAAAVPLLALAAVGSPADRAMNLRSLGQAQAASGQAFEALRSFSLADRLAPGFPPSATATLIARSLVRRGGTAWGSLRYAPNARRELDRKLDARAIAIGADRILMAGARELVEVTATDTVPIFTFPSRPVDIAVGPRGAAAILLRDGSVLVEHPRRRGEFSTLSRVFGRARGIARDARDRVLVIDGGGHILELDDAGETTRTFKPRDVLDLALDRRGGVAAITRLGEVIMLDARGEVRWSQPAATAEWKWWGADTIATDDLGGVYVLAHRYGVVYALSSDGELLGRIDPPPAEQDLLRGPRGIVVKSDGSIVLLARDHQIEFYQ